MLKINYFWDFEWLIVDIVINIKIEKMVLMVVIVIYWRYVVFEKIIEDFLNNILG